jgi:hypothetical protein
MGTLLPDGVLPATVVHRAGVVQGRTEVSLRQGQPIAVFRVWRERQAEILEAYRWFDQILAIHLEDGTTFQRQPDGSWVIASTAERRADGPVGRNP